jgi:hypothetical protein
MEDFTIRPAVDLEVVHIIETMNSSGGSKIPSRLPEQHFDRVLCFLDSSKTSPSDELPCADDYVENSGDELDSLAKFDDDPIEIGDQEAVDISRGIETMLLILQDPQMLRFNCLGRDSRRINASEAPLSLATILHHSVATSFMKLSVVMKSKSVIDRGRIFVHSLVETRVLPSRFLVLCRFNRKSQLPEATFENEIMPDLICPGLLNRSRPCYINAFVQTLFHVLSLTLRILACPNGHAIVSEPRRLFAEISRHKLASAVTFSNI